MAPRPGLPVPVPESLTVGMGHLAFDFPRHGDANILAATNEAKTILRSPTKPKKRKSGPSEKTKNSPPPAPEEEKEEAGKSRQERNKESCVKYRKNKKAREEEKTREIEKLKDEVAKEREEKVAIQRAHQAALVKNRSLETRAEMKE